MNTGPDPDDEPTQEEQDAYDRTLPAPSLRLCSCGCPEENHGLSSCDFCSAEDCQGFTYDHESTMLALASIKGIEDVP